MIDESQSLADIAAGLAFSHCDETPEEVLLHALWLWVGEEDYRTILDRVRAVQASAKSDDGTPTGILRIIRQADY